MTLLNILKLVFVTGLAVFNFIYSCKIIDKNITSKLPKF